MQGRPVSIDDPVHPAPPCEADIRAELDRILSSPHLQASERRRAFLRFVVEETLSGRAANLKGYTIAVAVFRRDETFDSQADPVVRLEARRLRRDLDSYYVEAGSRNPVRISIPKGSYVPHFEWHEHGATLPGLAAVEAANTAERDAAERDAADTPGSYARIAAAVRTSRRPFAALAFLVSVLVTAAVSWVLVIRDDPVADTGGPTIAVLPFETLSSVDDGRYLASGISEELVGELMRFPDFRLYSTAIDLSALSDAAPSELGSRLGVAYVVRGSVRQDRDEVRVTAQLFDGATGEILWSGNYDRPYTPEALIGIETDLAGEIATVLGQPYGIVYSDVNRRASGSAAMSSYICVQRAYGYRRTFSHAAFGPVLACLEESVRRDPGYSDAWAMLGWMYLDAGRFEFADVENLQDQYDKAFEAASRAVELDPDSVVALKALSSINHYMGRYDEGERLARRAVELNPHDPDTLAQLGWRLAARGNFDEGIPFLERAIARSVNPPGWYFQFLAIDRLLKGDHAGMLEMSERGTADGSAVSEAFVAIAAAALGQPATTREALEKAAAFAPLVRDPAGYFRRHGVTEDIVDALVAGLENAKRVARRS